ncbi:MAG: DUF4783 domain-containing protein [Bacteroidales bacterium]
MRLRSAFIFALLIILGQTTLVGQNDDISNTVTAALKSADASKLAINFNSTIDLQVDKTDGSFSKKQAEIIISEFFKKSPVKSYTSNHMGSSDDGSNYIIGTYTSTNGKKYRVYVLLKNRDGKLLINQLQFEEE